MNSIEMLIDSLRYRHVATTAAQMREAADELDRLTAQLSEAHRALKRYGGHRGLCMSDFGTPADASCYCGFEAALAATEPKP